jgi:hypothetical protein
MCRRPFCCSPAGVSVISGRFSAVLKGGSWVFAWFLLLKFSAGGDLAVFFSLVGTIGAGIPISRRPLSHAKYKYGG